MYLSRLVAQDHRIAAVDSRRQRIDNSILIFIRTGKSGTNNRDGILAARGTDGDGIEHHWIAKHERIAFKWAPWIPGKSLTCFGNGPATGVIGTPERAVRFCGDDNIIGDSANESCIVIVI